MILSVVYPLRQSSIQLVQANEEEGVSKGVEVVVHRVLETASAPLSLPRLPFQPLLLRNLIRIRKGVCCRHGS